MKIIKAYIILIAWLTYSIAIAEVTKLATYSIKPGKGDIQVAADNGDISLANEGDIIIKGKSAGWAFEVEVYDKDGNFLHKGLTSKSYFNRDTQEFDPFAFLKSINKSSDFYNRMTANDKNSKYCPPTNNQEQPKKAEPSAKQTMQTKPIAELDSYIACYNRASKSKELYKDKIKNTVDLAVKSYMDAMPSDSLPNKESLRAIFTCLILRESNGFRAGVSKTGYVGFGQFHNDARDTMVKMLTYPKKSEAWLNTKLKLYKGKPEDINYLKDIYANSQRGQIMQKIWKGIPMTKRPALNAATISLDYLASKENERAVLSLSMMMIVDCQLKYKQWGFKFESNEAAVLACSGGYNMGANGFRKHALSKKSSVQKLDDWVVNLKNSKSSQKVETSNHIVGINRCAEKGKNYPMCGTQTSYCKKTLKNTNSCDPSVKIKCIPERCN